MNKNESIPKKARLRFSLRALMFALILLSSAWTITAIWGVQSMKEDWNVAFTSEVSGVAIAPFVVQLEQPTLYIASHPKNKETWFWFFGFKHRIAADSRVIWLICE